MAKIDDLIKRIKALDGYQIKAGILKGATYPDTGCAGGVLAGIRRSVAGNSSQVVYPEYGGGETAGVACFT